jgi:hypothetical protein
VSSHANATLLRYVALLGVDWATVAAVMDSSHKQVERVNTLIVRGCGVLSHGGA